MLKNEVTSLSAHRGLQINVPVVLIKAETDDFHNILVAELVVYVTNESSLTEVIYALLMLFRLVLKSS